MHHKEIGGQYSVIHTRANHDRLKKKVHRTQFKILVTPKQFNLSYIYSDFVTTYSNTLVHEHTE